MEEDDRGDDTNADTDSTKHHAGGPIKDEPGGLHACCWWARVPFDRLHDCRCVECSKEGERASHTGQWRAGRDGGRPRDLANMKSWLGDGQKELIHFNFG